MLPPIHTLSREDYDGIRKSGMFWVYYPDASGVYSQDVGDTTLSPIDKTVLFNELAGNECYKRPLEDDLVLTYLSLIKEEQSELFKAWAEGDIEETLDGAADLIVVASGLLYALGYNPSEVLDEVCNANLSKFCTTEDDAKDSVKAYENDGRYYDVHYTEVGDRFVIRGRKTDAQKSDYKILKGVNTRKPNFKHIMQEDI